MRHTPGPWSINLGDSVIDVVGNDRVKIAAVGSVPYWHKFAPLDKANARLIAAAPDLLAALEACVAMIDDCMKATTHDETGDEWVPGVTDIELKPDGSFRLSQARAALAKARGDGE